MVFFFRTTSSWLQGEDGVMRGRANGKDVITIVQTRNKKALNPEDRRRDSRG